MGGKFRLAAFLRLVSRSLSPVQAKIAAHSRLCLRSKHHVSSFLCSNSPFALIFGKKNISLINKVSLVLLCFSSSIVLLALHFHRLIRMEQRIMEMLQTDDNRKTNNEMQTWVVERGKRQVKHGFPAQVRLSRGRWFSSVRAQHPVCSFRDSFTDGTQCDAWRQFRWVDQEQPWRFKRRFCWFRSSEFEVKRSSKGNVTICCAQSSRKLYKNREDSSTTHKILSSLDKSL